MGPTIIQTSKVILLDLGEDATKPIYKDGKLVEVCAPFAFRLVHSAEEKRDPVTKELTIFTEPDDHVWFYEQLYEDTDRKRPHDTIIKRSKNIRYCPDLAHRPTSMRFKESESEKTLGVLYSADYRVSAKSKLFEICTDICLERKNYKGYNDWIEMFAEQGLSENIFRLAHQTRDLKVDYKLPFSTDRIVDPAKGWLYDSKRGDHILCCPASGKPVLNKEDEFIWAHDLSKRKPKPARTGSAPANGSMSTPKVLQKDPESKDSDTRQTERKRREINPPGQGSSREKLPIQRTSGERTSSQGDSKARPLRQGGSRDKLPSQSSSKTIPPKRSDSSDKLPSQVSSKTIPPKRSDSGDKISHKSDPKVIPPKRSDSRDKISHKSDSKVVLSKQSDSRDRLPRRSDTRIPSEKKSPDLKTTSGSGSTSKRIVAGRSQTFA